MSCRFSVDSSSDDKTCELVHQQLLQMIALGDMARCAMDSIRKHGYYEGPAPVVLRDDKVWHEGSFYQGRTIRMAQFQKRQPIGKEDLPPLNNLQLEFGQPKEGTTFGNDEVPLFVKGLVARQQDDNGYTIFVERRSTMGSVRINKNHLSFVDVVSRKAVHIYRHRSDPNSRMVRHVAPDKAMESALVFATRLAKSMVDIEHGNSDNGVEPVRQAMMPSKDPLMNAKTKALQDAAPQWFIEAGVVDRMFQEIHRYITIAEVMDS